MSNERKYDGRHALAGTLTATVERKEVVGECPSCGAQLHIGSFDGKRALLHDMPFCHYYGATDPDQILRDLDIGREVS